MDMHTLCVDLQAEYDVLDALLVNLDEAGWNTPTPALGWLVRDQISHLGWTDRAATLAVQRSISVWWSRNVGTQRTLPCRSPGHSQQNGWGWPRHLPVHLVLDGSPGSSLPEQEWLD